MTAISPSRQYLISCTVSLHVSNVILATDPQICYTRHMNLVPGLNIHSYRSDNPSKSLASLPGFTAWERCYQNSSAETVCIPCISYAGGNQRELARQKNAKKQAAVAKSKGAAVPGSKGASLEQRKHRYV